MNENLIAQLAIKATRDKGWLDRQLFAELIVRECAKLQHKNVIVGGVSDYNRGRRTLAEDILKHFGIEE